MKILWLDLNCSYAHSSLALPALHAQVMEREDVEWTVVRTTNNDVVGTTVDAIYSHKPDVIAATAWLFTHEQLLHIISRAKAMMPEVIVILGGPEFLGDNREYLYHHKYIDVLLRGEGEESFAQWLDVWNSKERWCEINGLCYIHDDEYHDGALARVMDFDKLKAPEESPLFCWDKPFIQLETTRGCFNSCAFCVSGMGDPMRTLPLERIRQRLNRAKEKGIRDIRILDRTFNFNTRHAIELIQLFNEYHPHLRFHLEIHPALLPQSLRKVLASLPTGLLHLEAGIQSLRQEVLDKSQRKGTLEQALDGLQFLCQLPNLITHADLIAGLPLYSLHQIYEDITTLADYKAGEIQLESLKLLPGTAMRRDAQPLGIRYSPLPPYEVLETNHISSTELQEARRLSRLIDAYYNTTAWQEVMRQLIVNEKYFLHGFLSYMTNHNYIDQPLSLERRGELLYIYCIEHYPAYAFAVTEAWIEAGMSLRKKPAEHVMAGKALADDFIKWFADDGNQHVVYGKYKETLRLYFLPNLTTLKQIQSGGEEMGRWGDEKNSSTYKLTNSQGIWYGYESTAQHSAPVFKAIKNKQL